ncbi:hypothetical protein [Archaeoglobus profundus]|uniref:Uncharacterized protein n=1 Tax=Archaeoglobus profundus (strain DSM 5631 / JCM 9629 / NBRC 100127 / Av18) TaxID=572546 RepID=D2RHA3_ARCPA|nr:hypothetical protein [Archaeoglobus profundus]ADB57678.1 hypothetical protein Arcpr_0613 [Archaeoglobus profundus DSM 5631]
MNSNLIFAATVAGLLLTVLIVWVLRKIRNRRTARPCEDDIEWWRGL